MKHEKQKAKAEPAARYVTRAAILELLSDTEVATVSTAEGSPGLLPGDEYLDLVHLDRGVQLAVGRVTPPGRLLPKKAVLEETWDKISMQLPAPRVVMPRSRRE